MNRPYVPFRYDEVKPTGWIARQLRIQADGLAGNLDKVWPDVRDSAWIGGDREGWERVPYWLDGFIPLAFLLRDGDMISRAEKYLNAIMDRQKEDGWICPCEDDQRINYDLWAVILISKVLAEYGLYANASRAKECARKTLRNLLDLLKKKEVRLFEWGKFRWFEAMIPLKILQDETPEPWISELASLLKEQGANYADYTEEWKEPLFAWEIQRHIVNLAMMLKAEAAFLPFSEKPYEDEAQRLYDILDKYNGTAVGIINGDECLAGVSPSAGTELCAVVETMYSCEILFAMTGDPKWADMLERVSFNALPATTTEDMWAHQYLQQANQICCATLPGRAPWTTNNGESHVFGLEPNYGCCTANFGQGWPKLAHRIFLRSEDGIVASTPLPCALNTEWNGVRVSVEAKGDYPFGEETVYEIETEKPVSFAFRVRIPKNARASLNGKPVRGRFAKIEKEWSGKTLLRFRFQFTPELLPRPKRMAFASYGPLVFVLPLKSKKVMKEYVRGSVERKFPYADYEFYPQSAWAYGYADRSLSVQKHRMPEIPFSESSPGLTMEAVLAPVEWPAMRGYKTIASPYPPHRKAAGKAKKYRLIPYGCSTLRMTELPLLRKEKEKNED